MFCKILNTCRICHNDNLHLVLNLGNQPLANDYHDNTRVLDEYPLRLNLCTQCFHLQLSHIVDPVLLYKNYQYVSGTSKTLHNYFDWLANKINVETHGSNILEIACNDGSQLDIFKKLEWNTYGVDPATNIVNNITEHKVYDDFFTLEFAKTHFENVQFDVILAQNVLAHLDDVHDFIQGCKHLMNDNTTLYIQTSQCNMILNNEFDTIYHEHHSFFSVNSMRELLSANGLYLHKIEKTDIHGTSFLFTIKKVQCSLQQFNKLSIIWNEEFNNGLYDLSTYIKYANNVHRLCDELKSILTKYQTNGYKIIGYGAAAKGNTLLNFLKQDLDYILDDAKLKINLYTPGMNIPIYPITHLLKDVNKHNIIILPLAWNFFNEIREKIVNITMDNVDITFIKYFPEIEIVPRISNKSNTDYIKPTVLCHFYNEEYLLPYWLNHHKYMFGHGILIDYNSTDSSVDIIKSIVPNWEIIQSRNDTFDAHKCDMEVMDIEKDIKGWKIVLNVTEFLCCPNLSDFLSKLHADVQSVNITCVPMIESYKYEYHKTLDKYTPLVKQRAYGIKDSSRHTRTLHRAITGKYGMGRHTSEVFPVYKSSLYEMTVLWYGFSPFTEQIIQRKLQIQTRIPHSDKIRNLGVEHITTRNELIAKYNSYQPLLIDFKTDAELAHHFVPSTFLCWK